MPKSVSVLPWISDRADGAVNVHFACVPKSGSRIDESALVAKDRDYHTARASYIAPKSGGRTTRVLLVFVAAARTEDVRLTTVPKYG